MKTQRRAFTFVELLVVTAVTANLLAIAVPNFIEAETRAKIAQARSDLASIAGAVESYRVDTKTYPAFGQDVYGDTTLASAFRTEYPPYVWLFAFMVRTPSQQLQTLTTPVAYLDSFPMDPFGAEMAGVTVNGPYGYWTVGPGGYPDKGWTRLQSAYIMYSFGPDHLFQLNVAGDFRYYDPGFGCDGVLNPTGGNPGEYLMHGFTAHPGVPGALTYDATNGTVSYGDIWRVGP